MPSTATNASTAAISPIRAGGCGVLGMDVGGAAADATGRDGGAEGG